MKFSYLFTAAIALVCIASCKKNEPVIEEPIAIAQKDPLELLSDSISYIIDGKLLIQKKSSGRSNSIMNDLANAKLDSVVKYQEYKSGDKDSVMFGRGFEFRDNNNNGIEVMFIKKYNRNQAQPKTNETSLFVPLNKLDLFALGKRRFALDFQRNNAQNGVVFELKGDYYGFQTNGHSSLVHHNLLPDRLQSQSNFEITKLQQLKSGKYLVEAKFNASVYWGDGTHIKKIEDGFLRIKINPEFIFF